MIAPQVTSSTSSDHLPVGLPFGSEIVPVDFTNERGTAQRLLVALPNAFHTYAVLANSDNLLRVDHAQQSPTQFEFLTIPTANHQTPELQSVATDWVDAASQNSSVPMHMMTLQGAQVFWNESRVAILAPAERLESLRQALIEVCWYDAELSELERKLGDSWPHLEADAPLAFTFEEKSLSRRSELQQRFQRIVEIRSRQTCLSPHVHCPHLHPPTLASQVNERFRERTRLFHRHEILGQQLEVFERTYEAIGQRSSDFIQSRIGHMLEWIIIVLLVTQILIWGFEILTSLAPVTTGQ